MADPQQADIKIERYQVKRAWGRSQRRVRITLTRRAAYGYTVDSYTLSALENRLLKALGDAGFHVHPDEETPK